MEFRPGIGTLFCRVCQLEDKEWIGHGSTVPELVSQYIVHQIVEHWELLKLMHEHPEMIAPAQAYALKKGWM